MNTNFKAINPLTPDFISTYLKIVNGNQDINNLTED